MGSVVWTMFRESTDTVDILQKGYTPKILNEDWSEWVLLPLYNIHVEPLYEKSCFKLMQKAKVHI